MGKNRNGQGCLGSLVGLFTVFALGIVLLLYLVSSRPKVRDFVSRMGVPLERLLPSTVTGFVPEAEDVQLEEISEDGLAYGSLSDARKLVYAQLLNGIVAKQESFEVKGATKDDIEPTYRALLADHPELFWVDGSTNYTYYQGEDRVTVTPGLNMSLDEVDGVRTQIESAANKFLSTIPEGASDYDVAKLAYEFVINTTDYNESAEQSQNIQSVFLGHASVCAGYARAYEYLLQKAGLSCCFVEGRIPSSGEEHAWNIVRIDGQYTYVDVTWGDPTYPGLEGTSPEISYDYLGLTTEEIARDDHEFDDASMWPACDSTSVSYYAHEGLVFNSYDTAALSDAFRRQSDSGKSTIVFKFSSQDAYAQARDALAAGEFLADDLRSLFQSSGRTDFAYQYQISDSLYIVKLFL